uniref:Uncharacterized protein n=1 Tax=Oryza glumipatula TaxID=40148 RepID=A0A0D9YAF2_9ORYZ
MASNNAAAVTPSIPDDDGADPSRPPPRQPPPRFGSESREEGNRAGLIWTDWDGVEQQSNGSPVSSTTATAGAAAHHRSSMPARRAHMEDGICPVNKRRRLALSPCAEVPSIYRCTVTCHKEERIKENI